MLPALWLAQDQAGYLTPHAMDYVARRLEQSSVSVYAVVEFYTMFHTSPPGEHHVQLCRTLSCVMRGAEDLQEMVAGELGIRPGGRSKDGHPRGSAQARRGVISASFAARIPPGPGSGWSRGAEP